MDNRTTRQAEDARGAHHGLAELQEALAQACAAVADWPAKVAAGVYAGIDFAVADRDRALSLLNRDGQGAGPAFDSTVDCLDGMLRRTAPAAEGGVGGAVQGIAMIVFDHVRAGRSDELRSIRPALVQFALQPYLDYAEAKRWSGELDPR